MLQLLKKTIDDKKPFDFSGGLFDYLNSPNTIEIWDGNTGVDKNVGWTGIINSNVIDFTASVTLPLSIGILNALKTVIFNGTDQFGVSATPVIGQPATIYLVTKQIVWNGGMLIDDGSAATDSYVDQCCVSPEIELGGFITSNQLILNQWGIITICQNLNQSFLRINLNNIISTIIVGNRSGLTLACSTTLSQFFNGEFAYIIMRDTADPIGIQNSIISQLKTRFAI